MGKKLQYIIILSALLLFMMYVLNPRSGSFATYIKKNRHIDPSQQLDYIPGREFVAQKIGSEMKKGELDYDIVKRIIFSYKSYLFFSKATFVEDRDPSILEKRYYYIGIFDNFIPIGSEIPDNELVKSNSNLYVPRPSDSVIEQVPTWKYVDNVDKKTGGNIHVASIDSKTKGFELIIRKMKGRSLVFLTLEGQFVPEIPSVGLNIKFDNGKIENWACDTVGTSNNSVIVVLETVKFISRVKNAKNLRIYAEVYNEGVKQMEFDVEGLKMGISDV